MSAVISGRAEAAVLIEGGLLFRLRSGQPEPVPCRVDDLPYLFGDAGDLQFLDDATAEDAARELERAGDCETALHLCLITLDGELSSGVRLKAADALEEYLADDEQVLRYLSGVLHARPAPQDSDLPGAIEAAQEAKAELLLNCLKEVEARQATIQQVWLAWEAIPNSIFGTREDRLWLGAQVVRAGLFVELASAFESDRVGMFVVNSRTKSELKSYRDVFDQWTAGFRSQRRPRLEVLEQEDEEWQRSEGSRANRKGRGGQRALERVERQKIGIVDAIRDRDLSRARQFITELVEHQLESGGPEFAAKSLCDLAMEAKESRLFALQLELTDLSIELKPDDARAWRQHGNALLMMGRLEDALVAYDQSEFYELNVFTKTGRGEVLKAMGRLSPALNAYDEAISLDPENEVAKSGRAEVLKAMGRLDEALTAYDEAIRLHPENEVAKSGRAEVLKTMGRLDEALTAYDEAIRLHPEDEVAKSGRAEVLKTMGRLDEAFTAYDEAIRLHPENEVAKNGRAEVLKVMGRLDEALAAYSQVISLHPEDVFAKTGRAEVLKTMGRLDEALTAYDEAIRLHPENEVAKNGRAEALKAMGRLDDALAAYNEIIRQYPEDVVTKNGRAEALKAMGRLDDALAAYNEIISLHPYDEIAKTGRIGVLLAQGHYAEALAQLPVIRPVTKHDWINHHMRGMVLLSLKRIEEAIDVFEYGATNAPFPIQRQYFYSALAVARIRQHEFMKATEVLERVQAPLLQSPVSVLRVHALGALGERNRARAIYDSLMVRPVPGTTELLEELHHRYLNGETSEHDDEWVANEESRLLLQFAM